MQDDLSKINLSKGVSPQFRVRVNLGVFHFFAPPKKEPRAMEGGRLKKGLRQE